MRLLDLPGDEANPLGHTPPPDFKGDPARHCGPYLMVDYGPRWPFVLVLVLCLIICVAIAWYF